MPLVPPACALSPVPEVFVMDLPLIVSVLAWFVAAFVTGLCGIGAAAIATAIQITVLPVQTVVLVSCLTGLAAGLVMCFRYGRYCRWTTALLMFAGTIPGSLAGLQILQYAPATILEVFVGIMLIFCTAGMALFRNLRFLQEGTMASFLVGVAGGMLGTCVNIDGPVVALYGLQAGWQPLVFLGTTSIYFFLRIVVTCTVQASAGLYTAEIVHYVQYCAPFAVLGLLLAMPVIRRINTQTFRRVVQAVILLAGILCLGRALV